MQRGPWKPEPTLTRLQAIGSNVVRCLSDLHIRPVQPLRELLPALDTEWGYGNSAVFGWELSGSSQLSVYCVGNRELVNKGVFSNIACVQGTLNVGHIQEHNA